MPKSNDIVQSLSEPIGANLTRMGITQLTPIQQNCFGAVTEGRDVVAQSQTGSGKTLAFVMPILSRLLAAKQPIAQDVAALILVPTRELAVQVAEVVTRLAQGTKVRVATIIGGDSYARQMASLRGGAQIVVGTPGRVADLEKRKAIPFNKLAFFVLDEVDQMLDIGFAEDIEALHGLFPHKVQTLFFSATMSPRIRALANRMVDDAVQVQVTSTAEPLKIEHKYFCVQEGSAVHGLVNALSYEEPDQALIFCETKAECDHVSQLLTSYGLATAALHSDLSQSQRTQTLDRFRSKLLRYLVATNVAARGIDIKELPLVVNIAVPFQTESYVHRTGRTGRAGASGLAWTFVTPRRLRAFKFLTKEAKVTATEAKIPTPADIKQRRLSRTLKEMLEAPAKFDAAIESDVEKLVNELEHAQVVSALKNVLMRNVSEVRAFDVKGFSDQPYASNRAAPAGRRYEGRSSGGENRSGDSRRRDYGASSGRRSDGRSDTRTEGRSSEGRSSEGRVPYARSADSTRRPAPVAAAATPAKKPMSSDSKSTSYHGAGADESKQKKSGAPHKDRNKFKKS